MRTDELLAAVREARVRADVVPFYSAGIKDDTIIGDGGGLATYGRIEWAEVNAAIMERWSESALLWIKNAAWRPLLAKTPVESEGRNRT